MKKVLLVLFILATGSITYAQTSDAEIEAMSNLLTVQKTELIAKLVNVSRKDSTAFWKIYKEYQEVSKKSTQDRIKLYERTAKAYSLMTPAVADSLAQGYFFNRMDSEKTLEQYYKKIKTSTNAVVAFQFYQAEVYLLTQVRAMIMQQIPTYGEVQNAMKKGH